MLEVIVFEGVQNLPLFAAQKQGFFAERDVDVNMQFTPNSRELRDGLAEGCYQIAHTAVDNAIAMVEMAKEDVAVVTGGDHVDTKLLHGSAKLGDVPHQLCRLLTACTRNGRPGRRRTN